MRPTLLWAAVSLFTFVNCAAVETQGVLLPPRGSFRINSHRGRAQDGNSEDLAAGADGSSGGSASVASANSGGFKHNGRPGGDRPANRKPNNGNNGGRPRPAQGRPSTKKPQRKPSTKPQQQQQQQQQQQPKPQPQPVTNAASEPEPQGTGCQDGSTFSSLSEDGTTLTILFDNFQAAIGGKTARPDRRKFCTVTLNMTIPAGYTFAVDNIDWRGYVHIDKGVGGNFHSKFGFDDVKRKAVIKKKLTGPLTQDYLLHSGQDDNSGIQYLPCTGTQQTSLEINTAVSLNYPGRGKERVTTGSGLIAVDSVDGKLKQILNLKWQDCKHRA